MNFFKKLLNAICKTKKDEEKENECWYNNAHENGEAIKNSAPIESGGSMNAYEAHATSAAVRK